MRAQLALCVLYATLILFQRCSAAAEPVRSVRDSAEQAANNAKVGIGIDC
jgi:hypothetical protein